MTSDPFPYYEKRVRRGFGPACAYVQVKTHYRQNKIRNSTSRVVLGTEERMWDHIARSEDSKRPKSMKTDTAVLKRPMTLLLGAKKAKTKGQKRGTKYFVR